MESYYQLTLRKKRVKRATILVCILICNIAVPTLAEQQEISDDQAENFTLDQEEKDVLLLLEENIEYFDAHTAIAATEVLSKYRADQETTRMPVEDATNTALGQNALPGIKTSPVPFVNNTAFGASALYSDITGRNNTGVGSEALFGNNYGNQNVAVGSSSARMTTSSFNTAIGFEALSRNTAGEGNVALGNQAGVTLTKGNNNVYISNIGPDDGIDNGVMRMGTANIQKSCYIAGINGRKLTNGSIVLIDSDGKLGTDGDPQLLGDFLEAGNLDVYGSTQLHGDLTINGSTSQEGDLNINNNALFMSAATGNLFASGRMLIHGDLINTNTVNLKDVKVTTTIPDASLGTSAPVLKLIFKNTRGSGIGSTHRKGAYIKLNIMMSGVQTGSGISADYYACIEGILYPGATANAAPKFVSIANSTMNILGSGGTYNLNPSISGMGTVASLYLASNGTASPIINQSTAIFYEVMSDNLSAVV